MSGWRLAPGVRRADRTTLVGGRPYRIVRLTGKGADTLDALVGPPGAGSSSTMGPAGARLAARLVRAGLLVPPLPPPVAPIDVTVVIPARCAPGPVRRILAAVPAGVPVVVVDDASPRPLAAVADGHPNVRVVRHDSRRGAAAARNTGAAHATTRWILFTDADIEPGAGWIPALRGVVAEPGIVAAAPRIVNTAAPGLAGLVETHASALDMGDVPADVAPGAVVGYVPSAVLMADRAAFAATGGFEVTMEVGEDVDLVWRLASKGRIRYEPRVAVAHRARTSLRQVLARRAFYGESAAPLEARHPGAVRHAAVPLDALLPWLAAVAVHPAAGLALAALAVARPPAVPLPAPAARRLAAWSQVRATTGLGRWLARPMLPATALALLAAPPPLRRRLACAVALGYVDIAARSLKTPPRHHPAFGPGPGPDLDMLSQARKFRLAGLPRALATAAAAVVAAAMDDAGYSAGVWRGCLSAGEWAPLWPAVRKSGGRKSGGLLSRKARIPSD
jgi:mycofactocin system glycosyltransferase